MRSLKKSAVVALATAAAIVGTALAQDHSTGHVARMDLGSPWHGGLRVHGTCDDG
jgi:hypothetical protein